MEGGQWLARYSFIGTDPYLVVTSSGRAGADPFEPIAQELAKHQIISVEGLPRFTGGAVGYLSYETAARFEDLPAPKRDPLGLPESQFMFVDTLLVFDHVTHRIKVCSHVRLNGNIEKSYQEAVHRAVMGCYCRLGDRPAAIRQYHTCVRVLRAELGLNPAPETEQLYRQITGGA